MNKHNLLIGLIISVIAGLIVSVILALFGVIVTKPTVQLTVHPNQVIPGERVTISWDVKDADLVEFEGMNSRPEVVAKTDTKVIHVTGPTTVRIHASIGWLKTLGVPFLGTAVDSRTITILSAPTATFWSEPAEVFEGDDATLKWQTQNAENVVIKGIDSSPLAVEASGFHQVKVNETKTFEIIATNRAGRDREKIIVRARIPDISLSLSAEPLDVEEGGMTKLSWQSKNATTLSISGLPSGETKVVPSAGWLEIPVKERTTVEITATNGVATAQDSKTVTVHRRRLIFLGVQNANPSLNQVVRPEVENHFASREYDIIESSSDVAHSFGQYRSSYRTSEMRADYAVDCKATTSISQGRGARIITPWANADIKSQDVSVTVTVTLFRVRDGLQLATKSATQKVSGRDVQTTYGGVSKGGEPKTKEMEAGQKAVKTALAQLSL